MSDMTKTARVLTFVICYIFYIIIGASIFAAVEGPRETTLKKDLHLVIENFSKETSACLSGMFFKATFLCDGISGV